ncbi:diacylglycerol/polyprenol kinase family protein [Entomospira culicis]|uniref:Phosphatidate cytidylyltransferase n=1 Tax=Entomospira culicis TaxID=2719989 RepID=A0A968KVV9_9SPIO|nr:phosphatidate cytidylyltransferase [Entomospira culicis]NIZ19532.1 phosphatidate cytidylyltransferase [Entomospira culicis]NIZ69563.1 phosphatidate cytidylyltransferase [Entomospira culicis]WDI38303.1 phosphatidate cytidylyltransferase [Entomospira culicis]
MHQGEPSTFWQVAKQEFLRKFIHMASVLSIFVARYSEPLLIWGLAIITIIFIVGESIRLILGGTSLITQLVALVKRGSEDERPALGPITLSLGIMSAFLLFPTVAARLAVAALAFGDGIASLVGRLFGRHRPKLLRGKSIEGSLSCFLVVLAASYVLTKGDLTTSFWVALLTTFIEALPLKSFDNLVIPLCVGFLSFRLGY